MLQDVASVTIGRALDNDVILDDASVSRHHARLVSREGHWQLEDLDSTRGTFVNSRRVGSGYLRRGDEIRLGSVTLHVEAAKVPSHL